MAPMLFFAKHIYRCLIANIHEPGTMYVKCAISLRRCMLIQKTIIYTLWTHYTFMKEYYKKLFQILTALSLILNCNQSSECWTTGIICN